GPDIMTAAFMHGCTLTSVRYCLQTHPHADHLDPSHFLSRSPAYGVVDAPLLHFYASAATAQRTAQLLEIDFAPDSLLDPEIGESLNLRIHQIEALQSFPVGPYNVTAFPANHDLEMESFIYAVESNGRSIFYGTDTAMLPEETWHSIHQHKLRFDLVILDHTYGLDEPGSDHLNAQQFIEHVARMRDGGLLTENARVFATHIAHEGNPVHPELAAFAAQHGYEIAYDGLTV
ncbi:MAG: hypothetical protein KAR15_01330, partial [Desulfobacterales bacterium]|nr:hypothetical protein [Desulfobacterales bacterium]